MAVKKTKDNGQAKAVPTFALSADRAGHLQGLLAVAEKRALLPAEDAAALDGLIREFELWMDAQEAAE